MLTLALVGAGKWGQNYIKIANHIVNAKIKYVCTNQKQLQPDLPNSFVHVLGLNKLLEKKDIDGIIIATPSINHFEIAKILLEKRFNLLIEKPLTTNYQDALALYNIWEKNKPVVMVGHTQLYNPAYKKVKSLLSKVGQVKKIDYQAFKSPVRNDTSVIWDWGPHPISMCLDLLKKPVNSVEALASISQVNSFLYDTAEIKLKFEGGGIAEIKISWFGDVKIRKLTVIGTKGKIVFDDTINERKVKLYFFKSQSIQFPSYESESPLYLELAEFVNAIQYKSPIISDIKLGTEVIKTIDLIESFIGK